MTDSIKRISLDIQNSGSHEFVSAKKGDTGRKICISLADGGVPYIIGKNCFAVFTATKPDGKVIYNECSIENSVITYEITEQTVAVPGKMNCEIKIYDYDGKLITSAWFTLLVYGTVYDDSIIESTDEFSALTALVSKTLAFQNALQELEEKGYAYHKWDGTRLYITSASGTSSADLKGDPFVYDDFTEEQLAALRGEPGKSAYQYAQDGGYTGTEEEFAQKLAEEPLIGTTEEITPTQVAEAIAAGRGVAISHTDALYGKVTFSSFMLGASFNAVAASDILQYAGTYVVCELYGSTTNDSWNFLIQQIATSVDIPTKTSQLENDSGYITSEDIPASAGSGIHIGSEPPEDENVTVWIDTDEEPEASGGAQVDWNATEGEPGHVLNRTHYTEIKETVFLEETEITSADVGMVAPVAIVPGVFNIVEGFNYDVYWNGTKYSCTAFTSEEFAIIGNKSFVVSNWENTGEPFAMAYYADYGGLGIMTPLGAITATIRIIEHTQTHHRIPDKYAPIVAMPFYVDIMLNVNDNKATTNVTYDEVIEAFNTGRMIMGRMALDHVDNYFYLAPLAESFQSCGILSFLFGAAGNRMVCVLTKNSSGGYTCEVADITA